MIAYQKFIKFYCRVIQKMKNTLSQVMYINHFKKHTKRNAAPRMAPIHCTTMYATLKTKPIFLPIKRPIVTAGLIWHPDTCPITFQKV